MSNFKNEQDCVLEATKMKMLAKELNDVCKEFGLKGHWEADKVCFKKLWNGTERPYGSVFYKGHPSAKEKKIMMAALDAVGIAAPVDNGYVVSGPGLNGPKTTIIASYDKRGGIVIDNKYGDDNPYDVAISAVRDSFRKALDIAVKKAPKTNPVKDLVAGIKFKLHKNR